MDYFLYFLNLHLSMGGFIALMMSISITVSNPNELKDMDNDSFAHGVGMCAWIGCISIPIGTYILAGAIKDEINDKYEKFKYRKRLQKKRKIQSKMKQKIVSQHETKFQ